MRHILPITVGAGDGAGEGAVAAGLQHMIWAFAADGHFYAVNLWTQVVGMQGHWG